MSSASHQACILLGSNIEPQVNLPKAVDLLRGKMNVRQVSSVWESASVDCCYPDYLNMAALVDTELTAQELKEQVLRPLEASMGRVRTDDKNASRTIDLDIIVYDMKVVDPALWQHAHRAIPVAEIYPNLPAESGETLQMVARRLAGSIPIQQRKDVSIRLPSRS